jgi:hypothetical protein
MRIGSSGLMVSVFGDSVGVIVGVCVIVAVAVIVGVRVIVGVEVGGEVDVIDAVTVGSKAAFSSGDGPQPMSNPHIKKMITLQTPYLLKVIAWPPM